MDEIEMSMLRYRYHLRSLLKKNEVHQVQHKDKVVNDAKHTDIEFLDFDLDRWCIPIDYENHDPYDDYRFPVP